MQMLDFKNLPAKDKIYYQDDAVVIYCADNREILPLFPDKAFDLVLTDPPYGENQAIWDNEKPPEDIWDSLYSLLKDGGVLYYWGFWGHADWVLFNAKRVGFIPMSRIVWWFQTGRPEKKSYREDTENCWYFSKEQPNTFNAEIALEPYLDDSNYSRYGRDGKHPGTVWVESRIFHNHPEHVKHETQKPLSLFRKIIQVSSNPSDLILDPFLGSGTTAVAAKILGRKCIGIEISEKYCEIAAKRCSQSVMQLEIPKEEVKQGSF